MEKSKLKDICEVLVFASDTPITIKQIQDVVEEAKPKQIEIAINALNEEYRETNRTFSVVQIAGGYQMVTRNTYAQWIRKLFHRKIKSRLSQAALEALSVIAFKQPISKPEVEAVRGVNCDGVIKTLLERKMITMAGRSDGPGKPLLYKTTPEFLRYFGINDISDLPKPREIEEILKEETQPDEVEGVEALQSAEANAVEKQKTSDIHEKVKSDRVSKMDEVAIEREAAGQPEEIGDQKDGTPAEPEEEKKEASEKRDAAQ